MKIRKAILTGGGRATRLYPITTTINKHLLPLANKPMIFHAIDKVVEAGITEIFINVNPGETELEQYIGDGGHWGISIKFFEQKGGPQGIAHVVNEAKQFIGDEPFLFYLSDNILLGSLKPLVEEFNRGDFDCLLALSQVSDPERFGVPIFDSAGKLIDVHEKPANPPNNFAVTGIYLYGPKLFFEAFNKITKSARGEYEISSIHSLFLKDGRRVGHKEITGWWKDTGKHEDLLLVNQLLLDKIESRELPDELVGSAEISGVVHIGIGARVGDRVRLIGPVIIGENCVLENCTIGPYVTVGQGTELSGIQITKSIVLDNCAIDCEENISHSLIGKKVTIRRRATEASMLILGDKSIVEL
ncbi:MAG: glucose-1-phosphate thymidylyltransferase [Candidatus Magasanikbacteria bacterium RIFCSPHIGHO2_01_FULL_41_23]|uniref:Glucose-1-phosphate thymidylyltransferase n=1 Tax=Candidatus Magasanikbacteria bacterium RIFCSPLOWO2_01_FULL_40_15 TaxID=1798686 RepID=A0A1F6N076_9BACT|nr:MAG: glucose-1-phosphate thymidylyltransferase [Candidatus Magasanikbacteria bacterium RIFCSPHIGHO2_01_FULL_41_23]OGH74653.1 MAG: glucose-1-phosphate thymidylyltransferase [Candidatus Magasanikbacteria bacterium RIFCSPHIGHO2_12_FULL_41_16]OGH77366.1 MAG: glucose-1-phosphate thymidylyltransferase [Candidatus Magasanikbacteria bacterium RIFCSPLOWO2_01_FULL_40_15]